MQTISAVTTMLSNHNKTQQRQQSSAMSINSATLRPNRETIANIATTKSLVGPRLRSKSRSKKHHNFQVPYDEMMMMQGKIVHRHSVRNSTEMFHIPYSQHPQHCNFWATQIISNTVF